MAYKRKSPMPIVEGGTDASTFTAYAPVCGGTSSTGPLQSASTGLSTSGYILTSTGSSSTPSWQAPVASSITVTGDSGGGLTGDSFTFTGGTTGITFSGSVSTETLTGTLVVSHGGTGDASFTAYAPVCGGTTTTGALQSASTGISTSGYVLTSTGSSSLPSWQAVPSTSITIDGDSGSASGSTITFNSALTNAGGSVSFTASSSTVDMIFSDMYKNTYLGSDAGSPLNITSQYNVAVGNLSFNNGGAVNGQNCVAVGYNALHESEAVAYSVAIGSQSMSAITSGGSYCTAVGASSLGSDSFGYYNTAIGYNTGSNYVAGEASNILLNSAGVASEINTLHIGQSTGSGNQELNKAFICGINGISVSTADQILVINSSDQIGSIAHGTSGYVLTSNGSGSNPSWEAAPSTSITITGDSGGGLTGTSFTLTGGSTGITFAGSGTTESLTGTVVVSHGGTGDTSFTAYAPVCGGTTTTGALQSASSGISTSGYVLTSTGSSSLPSWQAPAASSITITGNSGGGLTGDSFTFTGGTTGITFSGSGSTETLTGTLVVANGGTGDASFTAYAPVCGGTTTTGALQSASTGISTSGYVLTSTGSSSLPTWQASAGSSAFQSINIQTFTSSNTYTPTSGMQYCTIEVVGGGGGGGGSQGGGASYTSAGGGGGGGGYARKTVSSSTIGASQTVTVGTGGSAGANTGGNGGAGNTSSVGSIVSASGGGGGGGGTSSENPTSSAGGSGGTGTGGDINASGNAGSLSISYLGLGSFSGAGGNSIWGSGGKGLGTGISSDVSTAGNAGINYGGGGSGGIVVSDSTGALGGAGAQGLVVITEYIN